MLNKSTPEYAQQTVEFLQSCWECVGINFDSVEKTVEELKECKAWEVYPPESPAGSLDDLLCVALGVNYEDVRKSIRNARTAQELAASEEVKPLAANGEIGRGRRSDDIRANQEYGTSAEYIVRRLKRDFPDVAEKLAEGEYKSARAAGIAAGIVKVPTRLDLLRRVWKKATPEERAAFLEEIHCP